MSEPKPSNISVHPRARIIRAAEVELWSTGDRILADARREAEWLRDAARTEFAAERARGFEEGRRAGAEEAARLLAETSMKAEAYFRALEASLPDLVLDALERLLGERDSRDALIRAIAHALTRWRGEPSLKLRVPPAQIDEVRAGLSDLLGGEAERIRIEGDGTLSDEDAVLVSEIGFVKIGLKSQIAALRAALRTGDDSDIGQIP